MAQKFTSSVIAEYIEAYLMCHTLSQYNDEKSVFFRASPFAIEVGTQWHIFCEVNIANDNIKT